MPGIIKALGGSGTPFSILTKGTLLARDLPELAAAARDVPGRGRGVAGPARPASCTAASSRARRRPAARLDLVRRIRDAGLPCGVFVAPVLPGLTDSDEALDALLGEIAAAGASGASVLALHLRPGTREWFHAWLAREHPALIERYAALYRRGRLRRRPPTAATSPRASGRCSPPRPRPAAATPWAAGSGGRGAGDRAVVAGGCRARDPGEGGRGAPGAAVPALRAALASGAWTSTRPGEVLREQHRAVLATRRTDGAPQLSPIVVGIDDDGAATISTRETAVKTKNLRREGRAWLCVLPDALLRAVGPGGGRRRDRRAARGAGAVCARSTGRCSGGEHDDWDGLRRGHAPRAAGPRPGAPRPRGPRQERLDSASTRSIAWTVTRPTDPGAPPPMMRTHPAGTLRAEHVGATVTLAGWVARRRDHGGVVFIDLRDASGVVQVVFREGEVAEASHRLRAEFCVQITGEVVHAPGGQRERRPRHRRRRGQRHGADGALGVRAAAVPARRARARSARTSGCATATSTCAARARRRPCACAAAANKIARDVLSTTATSSRSRRRR